MNHLMFPCRSAIVSNAVLVVLLTLASPPPASGAPSPPNNVVVPNSAATNDTAFGAGTLVNPGYRNQTVYDHTQFPLEAILITELRYRPDFFYGKAFSTRITNIQINLSTTAAVPDALSTTFAQNVGKNDMVVVQGAVDISSAFSGPANGPKDFDIVFSLKRPFFYNPNSGNLLVDVRNYSGSDASLVSGVAAFGDGGSRLGATVFGTIEGTTGTADTGADAMQIGYRTTAIIPSHAPPSQPTNTVVVPNILADADSILGSGTLANAGYRNQQVYDSNQFPLGQIRIRELRFRPDSVYGQAFGTTIQNIQINMSTTTHSSDALSSVYAENVGPDDAVVVSGAISVSSSFTGPTDGPKDFDIVVRLSQPFLYNPAAGNLLIDVRNYSGSTASLLSGSAVFGEGASRVGGNINEPAGFADTAADAIQIAFTPAGQP